VVDSNSKEDSKSNLKSALKKKKKGIAHPPSLLSARVAQQPLALACSSSASLSRTGPPDLCSLWAESPQAQLARERPRFPSPPCCSLTSRPRTLFHRLVDPTCQRPASSSTSSRNESFLSKIPSSNQSPRSFFPYSERPRVLLKPRSRTYRPQFPSRNSPVRLGASETLTRIRCSSARRSPPSASP
jgi:hypothetical protein